MSTGNTVALIKSLAKVDPTVIQESVESWLDDHPEATTTVQDGSITKAKLDSNLQETVDDVSNLKTALNVLRPDATATDVGKALIAKTVANGKVTEYEFGETGSDLGLEIVNGELCVVYEEASA